jgi:hypothetical protein
VAPLVAEDHYPAGGIGSAVLDAFNAAGHPVCLRHRHTAASWLVQDGVPLYDVQALLGHESFATTQRYAHLAPDAHGKVIESWSRRLGAPVAHGQNFLVGLRGLEPRTSSLSGKRSNRLSYRP